MTTKELIEILKNMPEDATIITSCDYGMATVKGVQHKECVEDVIVGDYLFNTEDVHNAIIINVDKED
jgi:hypothetical protein